MQFCITRFVKEICFDDSKRDDCDEDDAKIE